MASSRNTRRNQALSVFSVLGLGSVLLDLDHVASLLLAGLPITWENLARHSSRALHWPIALVVGIVTLACSALVTGWAVIDALAHRQT